ncbi:MAG: DUF72 domain-containing protein [Candidatus Thermoplasmatota archaeon]|nr:DUF72 domain-containing protein [Candidatus Thermoplasmatota archaeon]
MEINSSFYSDIPRKVVSSWIGEYEGKDFLFSLKAPRSITHQYLKTGYDQVLPLMDKFLEDLVWPLKDSQILGRVLFQLPPFYGPNELDVLLDVLKDSDMRGAEPRIEVRSDSMIVSDQVFGKIEKAGYHGVIQDSPDISLETSAGAVRYTDYVRLHGRNIELWGVPGSGLGRYSYAYSDTEISNIYRILNSLQKVGDDIFIYFNNHPGGNATMNAMTMQVMTGSGNRVKLF